MSDFLNKRQNEQEIRNIFKYDEENEITDIDEALEFLNLESGISDLIEYDYD